MIHLEQQQRPEARGRRTASYVQTAASDGAEKAQVSGHRSSAIGHPALSVALLTGGGDKPYALGIAAALTSVVIHVDFIGSDDLSVPELLANPRVIFRNLRGEQYPEASLLAKTLRVLRYYAKLIIYAAAAKPKVFHLLWNNKFELFDRTVLMLYYRLLGKRIVLTAHNVNAGKRDQSDSWLNRISLKTQYHLTDHIFVHANEMKKQLVTDFGIPDEKVSVIPFGINNTVPNTSLSSAQAKWQLGTSEHDKVLLFFGNIAPYKGLEYLVDAFCELVKEDSSYRLLVIGAPKGSSSYWSEIERTIANNGTGGRIIEKIEYVPDETTELYFKAADVLILPYARVFQSGVLFLGYSFGLPAIGTDVGSLKEEIIEGKTGFICRPCDATDLARVIKNYFDSELFHNLEGARADIKRYANKRYSWDKVATITKSVYSRLAF